MVEVPLVGDAGQVAERSGHEPGAQSFEAAADAAVDESVAEADLDAAEQRGIDVDGQLDAAAGHGGEPFAQRRHLGVGRAAARRGHVASTMPSRRS